MRAKDILDLVILAAVWGASFLFMRIAVPEFGPIAMIELRVVIATLFLLPVLLLRDSTTALRTNWKKLFAIGAVNSAVPFCLLAYSTLFLSAGFAAILNATAPLFAAVIAWAWLSENLNPSRVVGLAVGIAGVIVLVWDKVSLTLDGVSMAVLAAIVASLFYGIGGNYTKRFMSGVSALTIATGSQAGAAVVLLPLAIWRWPQEPVSTMAWVTVIVLGVVSTGIAYILYFRLIANVGPSKAITVTFLTPAFAMLWGAVFIGEAVTASMIGGCAIILSGTALATGLVSVGGRRD